MTSSLRLARRNFRPGWKLSLFVAALLPLLVWLGFWQLHRAAEKRAILSAYDTRRHAPPVRLAALQHRQPKAYQRVTMTGRFLNSRVFLLDNRTYRGQPGFEVITPLVDAATGQTVFVDRGWIAGFADRTRLPEVVAIPDKQRITAEVYPTAHDRVAVGEWAAAGWPKVIQSANVSRMATTLGRPAFGWMVRLPAESPWAFRRIWRPVNMPPARHVGYAVQWFCMAAVLAGLYIATGFGWLHFGFKRDRTREN